MQILDPYAGFGGRVAGEVLHGHGKLGPVRWGEALIFRPGFRLPELLAVAAGIGDPDLLLEAPVEIRHRQDGGRTFSLSLFCFLFLVSCFSWYECPYAFRIHAPYHFRINSVSKNRRFVRDFKGFYMA